MLVAMNGLTFCLIVSLMEFFSFINTGAQSVVPAVEIMVYLIILVILTSVCFR